MRLHRRLAACLLCLVLAVGAGCSLIKVSYNRAPALTYWWLDRYLDFEEAQKPVIRQALARLHAWHYAHELPGYIQLLGDVQHLINGSITPAQVCSVVDRVRDHANALNAQAARITITLAPSLTPDQLTHLADKFEDRNEDWREDWMEGTPKARQAYRLKQAVKRAENLYGTIDDQQVSLLALAIATSSFDAEISYAGILYREQEALRVLHDVAEHRLAGDAAADGIKRYYDELLAPRDQAYAAYIHTLTDESCRLIADFHNTTTPAQRKHATEKLQDYIDDLSAVRQPVTPS